jgi:alkyl sulfatase BDS1-like metallo-beta-lactamase superfamily hydrolase
VLARPGGGAALCMAENATHTLHNLLTLRGALVRDPVGAENSVTSCDLHVLVQKATEAVAS